jgi:SAM-dependent methyltransferase
MMEQQRTRTMQGRERPEMETISCPICAVDDTRPFLTACCERIVRCQRCGLVYVNPRARSDAVTRFFFEEYIPDEKELNEKFSARRAPALAREAAYIKEFKDAGRILDVGCAGGDFLEHFPARRWEREGIDPSRVAAGAAQKKGIAMSVGLLADVALEPDHYDVISVIDTLFFMAWPLKNLRRIREALHEDGILAVEIPVFAFRMMRNIGPISLIVNGRWFHLDENSPHLFYYSRQTIRKLLKKAGFMVISEVPIPSPSYGPWIYRALMRMYHGLAEALFFLSFKRVNLAAKTLLVCRKTKAE